MCILLPSHTWETISWQITWTQPVPVLPARMLVCRAFKVLSMPRGNIFRFILQLKRHEHIFLSCFCKTPNTAASTAAQLVVPRASKAVSALQGGTPEHSPERFRHDWAYSLGYCHRFASAAVCYGSPFILRFVLVESCGVHMLALLCLRGKPGVPCVRQKVGSLIFNHSWVWFHQGFSRFLFMPCKIFQKAENLFSQVTLWRICQFVPPQVIVTYSPLSHPALPRGT